MRVAVVLALVASLAGCLLLAGCGAGDPTGLDDRGITRVTSGGTGSVAFGRGQQSLSFANSVTVVLHNSYDRDNHWTAYTLFGLTSLNYRQVPTAALVTFVKDIDPTLALSTELPSTSVAMALHWFSPSQRVAGLPVDPGAAQVYESATSGTFVMEERTDSLGQVILNSPIRQLRYAAVTLRDTDTTDELLIQGSCPFWLSIDPTQEFVGYAGDLNILRQPNEAGGGPPSPPGQTTGGITGGGSSGGSTGGGPPSPPLRR